MLPKPNKDHSSPLNYRPISLLNSLAKLFEKVLLKRLHFALKKLIREEQYGFKKGHSTTHALLRLVERIALGFNNNKSTIALFLDIERAFGKVWTTGLISKLNQAGVPAHYKHIIHSYLHNRVFTFVHGNFESSRRPIQAGVPHAHTFHSPRPTPSHVHAINLSRPTPSHMHAIHSPRTALSHVHAIHSPRPTPSHVHAIHSPRPTPSGTQHNISTAHETHSAQDAASSGARVTLN
jgi:hypothetical protein